MAKPKANWKRSRLATGGAIVLLAGLWTGPQMADAASVKPAEAPPRGAEQSKPDDPKHGEKGKPTTTTTTKPTTTTTKPPSSGGGGGSTAPGNGGGGSTTPGTGGSTTPPGGTGGGKATTPPPAATNPPPAANAPAPSGGGSASTPAPRTSTPRSDGGPIGTRPGTRPSSARPAAPSVAVPNGPGESTVAALRGPDGAAQATARSMGGSQGVSGVGGPAFYAQLAASPSPLPSDDNPGNPYVTFTILSLFGVAVCFTGRRRVREDDGPVVAFA